MSVEAGSSPRRAPLVVLAALGAVIVVIIAFVLVRTALDEGGSPGPGWIRAATLDQVRSAGVVYVPAARGFVVSGPNGPIALSAISPHLGERTLFCSSSGLFEEPQHGEKFDRLGDYPVGPAPRGMDHIGIQVRDGDVWVDPAMVSDGPPRGEPKAQPPTGPFCQNCERSRPGFAT